MTDEALASLESCLWTLAAGLLYLPVANGAIFWLLLRSGEYGVRAHTLGFSPARDVALGLAAGGGMALAWVVFARRTLAGQRLSLALSGWPQRPPPGRLWTTSLAAVGEELLFRAVLQPMVGPVAATLLFAAAHVPWRRTLWAWPLTALVSGAVCAALYAVTGAVLAGVVAQVVLGLTSTSRAVLRTRATVS